MTSRRSRYQIPSYTRYGHTIRWDRDIRQGGAKSNEGYFIRLILSAAALLPRPNDVFLSAFVFWNATDSSRARVGVFARAPTKTETENRKETRPNDRFPVWYHPVEIKEISKKEKEEEKEEGKMNFRFPVLK